MDWTTITDNKPQADIRINMWLTRRAFCEKLCVMHTKLTLRVDDVLVRQAKTQAAQRGKSVSQMFAEYVISLGESKRSPALPPVTESLLGVMKGHRVSEKDYREHLREKYS